jgi:hypothetical protein
MTVGRPRVQPLAGPRIVSGRNPDRAAFGAGHLEKAALPD